MCRLTALLLLALTSPAAAQLNLGVPSRSYFNLVDGYYSGEYRDALEGLLDECRTSMKFGQQRWVDAIAYHTMTGESYYQLGQLDAALENYTVALQLYLANQDWMVSAKFDPAIRPAPASAVQAVPWGRSQRAFRLGEFKDETMMQFGQINNSNVVRQGGVVQQPMLVPVNVQEIVRTTALAMRRRRELLGPLAAHDPLNNSLIESLARRRSQLSHWSESWVDVELGMAYSAGGKDVLAKGVLERAIVARGEYDHPLTAMALLELGRLAANANDAAAASRLLEEATYAAVNFGDVTTLSDAFELGYRVHVASNARGMFAPLLPAAAWAQRQDLTPLQVQLLTMAAENACAIGETANAAKLITQAKQAASNSDILLSRWGARLNYTGAMILYQQGNPNGGDSALEAALKFQRAGGTRLFQIALVDRSLKAPSNPLSPRVAMESYDELLRDPPASAWTSDPLDALATISVQHSNSFDNWFDVAITRREYEKALEIADYARRHRFLSSIELGGRLLNLRWLLESPLDPQDQKLSLMRQDLLLRYPRYRDLSEKVKELRAQIVATPAVPDEPAAAHAQEEKFKELAKLCAQQETMLREIAVRREPIEMIFPPLRKTADVQKSLAPRQGILLFFCTSKQTHAFLMSNDKFAYWMLSSPAEVEKRLVELLHTLGNWDQNKQIKAADLKADWRHPARELYDMLVKESKADLPYTFDELTIVPDNVLWYLPFEALQVRRGTQDPDSLITMVKLRYAPTMGLAMSDTRPRLPNARVGVVLRRMFPGEEEEVLATAFDDYQQAVPEAVAVQGTLTVPSSLLATLFDQLTVLADVAPAVTGVFNWSPVPLDDRVAGSKLSAWMTLPWGGPDQVLLPGFHTSAEDGLKTSNAGSDVFMSLCGLMGSGARTVLLSRWRTGGQSTYDLVREFAQELPHTTAADAWQRSVLLERDRELNPALEPRLNTTGMEQPPKGDHPFFWSGFILADTGAKPPADEPATP